LPILSSPPIAWVIEASKKTQQVLWGEIFQVFRSKKDEKRNYTGTKRKKIKRKVLKKRKGRPLTTKRELMSPKALITRRKPTGAVSKVPTMKKELIRLNRESSD